jgi:hypothetical protein
MERTRFCYFLRGKSDGKMMQYKEITEKTKKSCFAASEKINKER